MLRKMLAPFQRIELWTLKTADKLPLLSGLWFWVLVGIGPLAVVSALVFELIDLIPGVASIASGRLPDVPIPGWQKEPRTAPAAPIGGASAWVYPLLALLAVIWLISLWQAIRSFVIALCLSVGLKTPAVKRREKLTRLLAAQTTS